MKLFNYTKGVLALAAAVFLSGCDPEIDAPASFAGQADFAKYIAIGNSLTAGTTDGGVHREAQLNSYPAILAQQFKTAGGGDFVQPLYSEEQRNGTGYLRLAGFTPQGTPNMALVLSDLGWRSFSPVLYTKYTNPIQNLGVYDIRVADIKDNSYYNRNPHYERITPDAQSSQTYLQRVQQSTDHTFFSLWLGNNDVLGYATSGGAFTAPARVTITPTALFETNYTEMVNALTAKGAKGIVATIPGVINIPYFTTVGPTVKPMLASMGVSLWALTGTGNTRIQVNPNDIWSPAGGTMLLPLTASEYVPLVGERTGRYWRQLARSNSSSQAQYLAVLTQLLLLNQVDTTQVFGLDPRNPWPSALLLDNTEQQTVQQATTAFNNIIKAQAAAKNLAVFDAHAYFNSITNGFTLNGVSYSPAFITGNLFSLDGVHPTPRGYAFVANEMIKIINAKYGSSVPTVDETQYRAVLFP